jgi:protein-disulfide isomerase
MDNRPTRHRNRPVLALLIVILIGWAVTRLIERATPVGRDVAGDAAARGILRDPNAPHADVPDATLTMVVFTDYQCPACRATHPAMMAAVAADGHVRLAWRDWPIFGPLSERAARVAIAADRQGIYPAVHDALMTAPPPLDDAALRRAVADAGGDWTRIVADLRDHDAAINAQLIRNQRDAGRLGLPGTPSYLIGGRLVTGAIDAATFHAAFAEARE